MGQQIFMTDDYKVTVEGPSAAGTSTVDSGTYDMRTNGYDGILFIVRFGTPAANNNIRAQQGQLANMTDAQDLAGTLVNSATLNQHMLDLVRPTDPFVRCRVTRGTSTTIDAIIVVQYRPGVHPVTQPATAVFEQWQAPLEGVA